MSYILQRTMFIFPVLFVFSALSVQAQLIREELMSGPDKTDVQSLVIASFGDGRFEFQNLAFFQRYHDTGDQPFDELGVQSVVFWNFAEGFGAGPGLYYNSVKGLMSKITFQTVHTIGPVSLVTNPAIYYHEDDFIGGELFAQIKYTRPASKKWSLFSQGAILTTWDRFKDHGRSFLQLRTGPQYNNTLQFGLATDFDWYGPDRIHKQSVGLFVQKMFEEM